jgi:hypothetical protein
MPLPLPPREWRRLPRHRTSSASKEPFAGPLSSPDVATRLALSTPVHLWLPFFAGLSPRAESPWASPAATGEACLDLTSLDDFCNHTEGRAHRADVRTSREAPFLGLRILEAPKGPEVCERSACTQHPRALARPAGFIRVSMRAAAAEANSSSSERPGVIDRLLSGLELPTETGRSRPHFGPAARTAWPSERPGTLSTLRKPGRNAIPSGPPSDSRPRAGLEMNAPFSRARAGHLDGWMAPLPAATHSRGPLGGGPCRGDSRRP